MRSDYKIRYHVYYKARILGNENFSEGIIAMCVRYPVRTSKQIKDLENETKKIVESVENVKLDELIIINISILSTGRKIRRR